MLLTKGRYLIENRTIRAGVIVYTVTEDGKIHFLLAKHRETGELGDFGGGIKNKELTLTGAYREFSEETESIFSSHIYPEDFIDKFTIVDGKRMAIVFFPVENFWLTEDRARKEFKTRYSEKSEMSELIWVQEEEFVDLIKSKRGAKKMWSKIRNFISKALNVDQLICIFLKPQYTCINKQQGNNLQ